MKPTFQISLLIACTVWAASPAWPEAEDLQVQQTITDLAEVYMSFPQTLDRHSVLRYFAPDYSYFDDAEHRSLEDMTRVLDDLEREVTRGPVSINEQISDIAVHTGGALAWATYQDRVTIAAQGGTMDAMTLCTAIFRKMLTGWVYRHEHCSSNTLDKGADHGELTKLARNLDRTASK